jgi:[ribosomal protein S5]-alanine N-acetyltransferase
LRKKWGYGLLNIIETERLIIREFTLEDIPLITQYSKEETKQRELPDEIFDTLEKATRQIEMCISNYNNKNFPLPYAIVLKEKGILIGDILLCEIQEGIEIGYFMSENYQGHGYATEAIKSFIPWAKENMDIDFIYGLAREGNIASWRALESAGFIF